MQGREAKRATLEVLVYCFQNVVKEAGVFDDLGAVHGFDVNSYLAETVRVSSEGDLFEGLVFLFAKEKV